jgi:hypothetical protein
MASARLDGTCRDRRVALVTSEGWKKLASCERTDGIVMQLGIEAGFVETKAVIDGAPLAKMTAAAKRVPDTGETCANAVATGRLGLAGRS